MTRRGNLARLKALEEKEAARQEEARAYLGKLEDWELDELHAACLRAGGHPDPEGEAARVRAEIEAMSEAELWALLSRLEGGQA